ncbi:MAG: hypothetical protein KY475_27000 [Planctomycetes bacterium]|nr:hypothetical protein [Planctomycetota bacterium]
MMIVRSAEVALWAVSLSAIGSPAIFSFASFKVEPWGNGASKAIQIACHAVRVLSFLRRFEEHREIQGIAEA